MQITPPHHFPTKNNQMPKTKTIKRGRKPVSNDDKKVQVTFYVQYAKLRKFGCEFSNNRAIHTEQLVNFLNSKIDEQ